MTKAKIEFLVVLCLCGSITAAAADLFEGAWKLDYKKSVLEGAASVPTNLTSEYKFDDSGNLVVTVKGFRDQTVQIEVIKNYAECDGTERALDAGRPPVNIWPETVLTPFPERTASCTKIGESARALDVLVRQNGKLLASSRRAVSDDGRFLVEIKTGVKPTGEYYRAHLVWERR